MGYSEYEITLPVSVPEAELRTAIARKSGLESFTFQILLKSLDARHKDRIVWRYRVGVASPELGDGQAPVVPTLTHDRQQHDAHVAVVGSGPAGVFAALYLARSGFRVTLLERGSQVEKRRAAIEAFESGGAFPAENNYSFGEGGAGTFSDGKLSSRTKGINAEREYVFSEFVAAGAPDEIRYMTHPHVGSDNLFRMTGRLRATLQELGCRIVFDSRVDDLNVSGDSAASVDTSAGRIEADAFVFACGHSAYDTYRMLMARGVPFRPKNFAIGFRAEHEQAIINRAQWGVPAIPGVKAAEYRLTSKASDPGVYSFCMCPGGTVVPAAAFADANIVNGKSDWARGGRWANAAVVASTNLETLLGREPSAPEALDWLENLERSYHDFSGGYRAPAMTVRDFLAGRSGKSLPPSSYPMGLVPADLAALLPSALVGSLRQGLGDFCRTLRGYEDGIIMGLESKTSSPVQALRDPEKLTSGYSNVYLAGEGAGCSGGIVSSAADGLKVARAVAAGLSGR